METETQTQTYNIKRGRTEIDIPHRDSYITFVYQKYGPNTYANVKKEIEQDRLAKPTMAETDSLIYQVFMDEQGKEPEFNDIKDIMKNKLLWAFTGTLYIPSKGAYIQDDPEIRNTMPYMEESELVRKLKSNDPSVRFVPFGFKIKGMSSLELAKNPYVIALVGEEGAEKLAEVADKFEFKPYLYSFDSVNKPLTKVSALDSVWGLGHRLVVVGVHGGWVGCAFGVAKN